MSRVPVNADRIGWIECRSNGRRVVTVSLDDDEGFPRREGLHERDGEDGSVVDEEEVEEGVEGTS